MAPPRIRLSNTAEKLIDKAVERLFERIKARFLGADYVRRLGGKHLGFSFIPELNVPSLFGAAAREEGVNPNEDLLGGLLKIAGSYLDAQKEKTKARTVHQVQAFLNDAARKGVRTDVETVLGGHMAKVFGDVTKDVKRILETETTIARNVSIHDAIGRIGAATQQDDPTVFFVTVRDQHRCDECTKLHVQPDGVTPRVWRQSELGAGYHKVGDPNPKIGGLHPHCRCVLTILMPGYGFDKGGKVTYIIPGHDEFAIQRGIEKSESEIGVPLGKAIQWANFKSELARFGWVKPLKQGRPHNELTNPDHPIPGPRIQNMHWEKKLESHHADKYARQVGLRLRPDNTLEVNDKDSGQTQHDYLAHYKKLGHYKDPDQPAIRSWTPEVPHQHVPIGDIEMPETPHDWKIEKFAGLIAGPHAGKVGPVRLQQQPNGRFRVLEGGHRFGAAYLAGLSHVPAVIDPR